MKNSEVYREARSILFDRGWAKGALENENGEVCLNGACNLARFGHAYRGTFLNYELDQALGIAAHEVRPDIDTRVYEHTTPDGTTYQAGGAVFNDHQDTDFNDMIDILERAEKHAQIQEEGE